MCLFGSSGQGVVGYFTPLLSFQSHPALTFPCRRWVSSCHRLFLRWSPPFTLSNCPTHSVPRWSGAAAFSQTPKIAQGVGLLQTPAEFRGVMCSSLSHNTQREESRSNNPSKPSWNPSYWARVLQCKRSDCLCLCLSHALTVVGGERQTECGHPVAAQSWTMKLSAALFFAGLFGALAAVFILLSFGTDYWLLASESCPSNRNGSAGLGGVTIEVGVQAAAVQGRSEDSQLLFVMSLEY